MDFTNTESAVLIERRKAIVEESNSASGDALVALENELDAINAELETRKTDEARRQTMRDAVAAGSGEVIAENKEERKDNTMTLEEIRSSKEYINAFADYIKTGKDTECRALLSTNVNGGYVPVPTIIEGRIRTAWERLGLMNLVRKTYIPGNLNIGFELSATGAVIHTEGSAAPSEEVLTLGVVELKPESIKKWITISDEAMDMGGEEFLFYIYDELTYRIAKKAQEELLKKIIALTASATSTAVGVGIVTGTPSIGVVASAIGQLSDEASNPVVVMNKSTWALFKAAQYSGSFNVDPFEGLDVHFDSTIPAYTASGNTGSTWMIVGDFAAGAHANFPSGDDITIKYDDLSLAESDLVKLVGREYIGMGIVADHAFCKVVYAG